jgi:hypothetical protein
MNADREQKTIGAWTKTFGKQKPQEEKGTDR